MNHHTTDLQAMTKRASELLDELEPLVREIRRRREQEDVATP